MFLWKVLATMGQIFNKGQLQSPKPNVIFILADDIGMLKRLRYILFCLKLFF